MTLYVQDPVEPRVWFAPSPPPGYTTTTLRINSIEEIEDLREEDVVYIDEDLRNAMIARFRSGEYAMRSRVSDRMRYVRDGKIYHSPASVILEILYPEKFFVDCREEKLAHSAPSLGSMISIGFSHRIESTYSGGPTNHHYSMPIDIVNRFKLSKLVKCLENLCSLGATGEEYAQYIERNTKAGPKESFTL